MSDRSTRCLPLAPLAFALLLFAAPAAPIAAQDAPLPGVGEVDEAIEWTGVFEPGPLSVFDGVSFIARGLVEGERDRRIGALGIASNVSDLVLSANFPAVDGERVRIVLLDGSTPVAEVTVAAGAAAGGFLAGSGGRRSTAAARVGGDVIVVFDTPPATLPRSVRFALFQGADFGVSGEVVPAPMFEVDLGARRQVLAGGGSHHATTLLFLADRPFPPPGASSAVLERVEVVPATALGGAPLPEVAFTAELVTPGALFSGVPVTPMVGSLFAQPDPQRDTIAELILQEGAEDGPPRAAFLTGGAAGLAARWKPADLAAGPDGSAVELAAIGANIGSVQVRGVVVATRAGAGWDLSFQPPEGLDGPRTVEIDGAPVGEVTVPAPSGVFARSGEPPSGAAVFPIGLGEGAFYGFSWDAPVAIEVPGAGTFTGREVRLVFPLGIGPLAFAGTSIRELDRLTLTGLAAPAVDDGGPCFATATRMCLAGGRFAVEARWADPFGGAGPAIARPLTADTGTFWFFDDSNLELMVKALDACPVNGHVWVFAGGLTNVEVELTVTDTRTGIDRVYRNDQGEAFAPIQDTAAFLCGP